MLHHEYDAPKGYRFLGGAISFYSVSCMSDVIFNPSLLNWSSLILTVAHIFLIHHVHSNHPCHKCSVIYVPESMASHIKKPCSTIHMVNNHVPMIGQSIIYIDPSSSSTSRGEDLPFNFGPSVHHGHDSQALILGLLSFQLSLCTQIFHEATSEDARESTCFFWAETVRVPKK